MQRLYPQLRGFVDPIVENELNRFITHLYEIIERLQSNEGNISGRADSPSATSANAPAISRQLTNNSVGLDKGVFSQPVLGEGSDPLLKSVIPDDVIHSNMNIVAGAVPVGGYVRITDGFGNGIDVLTK